jgi:hypothetical protein
MKGILYLFTVALTVSAIISLLRAPNERNPLAGILFSCTLLCISVVVLLLTTYVD